MTSLVHELEDRTSRAWPAREIIRVDGWECRFAGGYTGRANSVNPHGPVVGDLDPHIRRCEELFRERRLRPVFRITPLAEPAGLEAELEERGFVRRSETRVLTRSDVEPGQEEADPELEIHQSLPDGWLQYLSKWIGIPPQFEPLHRAILEAIRPDRAFALLRDGGRPAACGLAVREAPWVGLFDLATDPDLRGKGLGTRLVNNLLAWGWRGGARRAYLQVVAANAGAIRLYRRLGFRDEYPYSYRVSTEDSPWRLPKAPD